MERQCGTDPVPVQSIFLICLPIHGYVKCVREWADRYALQIGKERTEMSGFIDGLIDGGRINTDDMVACIYKGSVTYVPEKTFLRMTFGMTLDEKKYVRYKEGAYIYGMSEHSFMRYANAADCVYRANKIALVKVSEFDEYMKYLKG